MANQTQDALDRPVSEIEPPMLVPVGEWEFEIVGIPEERITAKGNHRMWLPRIRPVRPINCPEPQELDAFTKRYPSLESIRMFLKQPLMRPVEVTPDTQQQDDRAVWAITQFCRACKIKGNLSISAFLKGPIQGSRFTAMVEHEADQGGGMRAVIGTLTSD